MRPIKIIITFIFAIYTSLLFALPQTGKFVKCKYQYILEMDSHILKSSPDTLKANEILYALKSNIQCYKLKKKDLLLIKTFIYRVQLIVIFFETVKEMQPEKRLSNASRRKQLDLYRDYVTASAEIQARFERKYQRIKKRKCK